MYKKVFNIESYKNKDYNNVTRLSCRSEDDFLELDVHNILCSSIKDDKITVELTSKFKDGDYIMSGIIMSNCKISSPMKNNLEVSEKKSKALIVSFHGLLMSLDSTTSFGNKVDTELYCIINV